MADCRQVCFANLINLHQVCAVHGCYNKLYQTNFKGTVPRWENHQLMISGNAFASRWVSAFDSLVSQWGSRSGTSLNR